MSGPFDFVDRRRVACGIQFATHRYRCIFLGTSTRDQARWLNDNPDKWRSIQDIPPREAVPRSFPLPADRETTVTPADPNAPTSSPGDREDSAVELDRPLLDSPTGHCCTSDEPTSRPVAAITAAQRTEKDDAAPRADPTTTDAVNHIATSDVVDPIGSEPNQEAVHQPAKKKRQSGLSRRGAKRTPERMRAIIDSLAKKPCQLAACRKVGIHPNTLSYWRKRSAAGAAGYHLEWLGLVLPFHQHYKAAMDTGRAMLEVMLYHRAVYGYDKPLKYRGRVMYKIDPALEARGLRGPDAYLRDKAGHPIPETIRRFDKKAIKFLLQKYFPEKYGNHRKNDAPPQGEGLLVIHSPLDVMKSEQESRDRCPDEDVELDGENDPKEEK
jgi:hypothetical protein